MALCENDDGRVEVAYDEGEARALEGAGAYGGSVPRDEVSFLGRGKASGPV